MTSCEFCGAQLPEQSGVGRRARYCDSTCKKRARNEIKREICGGHVPSDLRGLPVDLAPELDHIIPLAKGGHHVWDNLGLAHRKCNLEKSDRMSL